MNNSRMGAIVLLTIMFCMSVAPSARGQMNPAIAPGNAEDVTRLYWREDLGGTSPIAISSDGHTLAVGSHQVPPLLIDLDSFYDPYRLFVNRDVRESSVIAFNPDGSILASGDTSGKISLWNVMTGEVAETFNTGIQSDITRILFSPDGKRLALVVGREIQIWDVEARTTNVVIEYTNRLLNDGVLAFSPDSTFLASASYTDEIAAVQILDADTGEEVRRLDGVHFDAIDAVVFSPDGLRLASGDLDSIVAMWDLNSGTSYATVEGRSTGNQSLAFNQDGSILATIGFNSINLWDAATGVQLTSLMDENDRGEPLNVIFTPDGTKIISSGYGGATVWGLPGGLSLPAALRGHDNPVTSVAFSPDGNFLASASSDNTVWVWDMATGEVIEKIARHRRPVLCVAFSPDGTLLASGADDGRILLWDMITGRTAATFEVPTGKVTSIAFSPDGTLLASSAGDATILLWDVTTGQSIATLSGHSRDRGVNSVAFSPDGTLLASGAGDSTIRLWDVTTGQSIATLSGHSNDVTSIAFSPDGTLLASGAIGARDNAILLWDVITGQSIATLTGHSRSVTSVAFSPDGNTLASASDDKTVLLWDVTTKELITTVDSEYPISSLAFSPDGTVLAAGSFVPTEGFSSSGIVRLWDVRDYTSSN